jgi:hypothetical protein
MTTRKPPVKAQRCKGNTEADKIRQALLYKSKDIAQDEWGFRACPNVLLDNCWQYELAREIAREVPEIIEAVAPLRSNPKTQDKNAYLTYAQVMFGKCKNFPVKPWLTCWKGMKNEEQEARIQRVTFAKNIGGFKTGQLKDLAGKDCRNINPIQLDFPDYPMPNREYNQPLQVGVYHIDWRFDTDQLTAAFRKWLVERRPNAFKDRAGRKTNPDEKLDWLGTYRLSKAGYTAEEINKLKGISHEPSTISRDKGKLRVVIEQVKEQLNLSTLSMEQLKLKWEHSQGLKKTQTGS